MIRTQTCRLLGASALLSISMLPSEAIAQAEFSAQIGWANQAQPEDVEFDTGSAQTRPFKKRPGHFLGERSYPTIHARQDFVIQWPGISITLRARAQVAAPGSDSFFFKVSQPNLNLLCNDTNVSTLFTKASREKIDTRVDVMQQILVLLEREDTGCNAINRKNLGRLLFALNCNLAKDTRFFDLSSEAMGIVRRELGNSTSVNRKIKACQTEVNGVVAKAAKEESERALRDGNYQRFYKLNEALRDLATDNEFKGAFKLQGIRSVDLQHKELEVLFGQYLARPRTLEIEGQPTQAERDAALSSVEAATRLERLSREPTYKAAFREAQLTRQLAKRLPATAKKSVLLVNTPAALPIAPISVEVPGAVGGAALDERVVESGAGAIEAAEATSPQS